MNKNKLITSLFTKQIKNITAGVQSSRTITTLQNKYEYDLAVIGGGSGGMACAKEAARNGAKVVLFDYVKPSTQNTTWGLGGTCVNVGCVPKKLMHYTALIGSMKKDGEYFGWDDNTGLKAGFNWDKLVNNVGNHIKSLNFSYGTSLRSANVKYINAEAKFKDENTIVYNPPKKLDLFSSFSTTTNDDDDDTKKKEEENNVAEINAQYIVIAVGGRPHIPDDVPGAVEHCISSDDIFWRKEKAPGKTLCVGGGYISLECAGFLNEFGYDTSVAIRSKVLRTFDDDCAEKIKELMESLGVNFLSEKVPKEIMKLENHDGNDDNHKLKVIFNDGDEDVFDTVLYATGRVADTKNLRLENVNIKVNNDNYGKILTNEYDQTNIANIFAIGDVVENKPELTPVAIQAGEYLANRLFNKTNNNNNRFMMDYDFIPTTIFTPFEYGTVGLSEKDAIAKYGNDDIVESYLWSWTTLEIEASKRLKDDAIDTLDVIPPNCFAKLVCIGEDERVIGFHFVGPNAGEVTQGFSLALRLGALKSDFDRLVGIHPTDAEAFTTMEVKRSEIINKEDYVAVGGCGGGKCG